MDENGNVKEQHRASRLPAGSEVKVVSPTCTRAVGRARFKMFSRRNRRITPCSQLFSRRASTPSAIQRLITATDALNYFVHGAVRRRYSRRGGCRGVWMAVRLPVGFLKHVDLYASGHGRSRNDALCMFLQDGLFCYLFGYTQFLKGITKSKTGVNGHHDFSGGQEVSKTTPSP